MKRGRYFPTSFKSSPQAPGTASDSAISPISKNGINPTERNPNRNKQPSVSTESEVTLATIVARVKIKEERVSKLQEEIYSFGNLDESIADMTELSKLVSQKSVRGAIVEGFTLGKQSLSLTNYTIPLAMSRYIEEMSSAYNVSEESIRGLWESAKVDGLPLIEGLMKRMDASLAQAAAPSDSGKENVDREATEGMEA